MPQTWRCAYLDGEIIAGGDQHFCITWIKGNTVHDVGVRVLGQAHAVVAVPYVRVHIFRSAAIKRKCVFDASHNEYHVSLRCCLPGHIIITNVQEYEEALGIRGVRSMRPQHIADRFQRGQIDDMDVNLLGDGRRIQRIRYMVAFWPGPTVHVQVAVVGAQAHADDMSVQVD